MTIRLDLHTRTIATPGGGAKTILERPLCYGCGDCGQWFRSTSALICHIIEHQEANGE